MSHLKTSIPLVFSSILLLVSYLFKVMHWPFGKEMWYTGFALIGILYFIRYMLNKTKTMKSLLKLLLVILWTSLSVLPTVDPELARVLIVFTIGVGIFWFVLEVRDGIKLGFFKSNLILITAALFLALEILTRIMISPGPSFYHVIALILMVVGFSVDKKWHKKKP